MRVSRQLIGTLVGLSLLLIVGAGSLAHLKFESLIAGSISERLEVVASSTARDFSSVLDLGLDLEQVDNGSEILSRAREHDSEIRHIAVFDTEGRIVHQVGVEVSSTIDVDTAESYRLATEGVTGPRWTVENSDRIGTGMLILGSFGQPSGGVVVDYPTSAIERQLREADRALAVNGLMVFAAMGILSIGMARLFRSSGDRASGLASPRQGRVLAGTTILLVIGLAAYGLLIVRDFRETLGPELEKRAAQVGLTVTSDIERAVHAGIPINDLVGVEDYLRSFTSEVGELDSLALYSDVGELRYQTGADALEPGPAIFSRLGQGTVVESSVSYGFAVVNGGQPIAYVDVRMDGRFVEGHLQDLALDVGVILVVVLVLLHELSRVGLGRVVSDERSTGNPASKPPAGTGIRLALLLFAVGEELNKSFLPLFIKAAHNPVTGLDPNVAIGLPIATYLLMLAAAAPAAGRAIGRFGERGVLGAGVLLAASSHLGMVFSTSITHIIGLRAITGIAYGLVTIAGQEHLLGASKSERSKAISIFVAAVIGGTFAGTALGGIFADRLGHDAVFLMSAGLVLISGAIALGSMKRRSESDKDSAAVRFTISEMVGVLRRRPIALLLATVTVPMSVLAATYLWYLVPLTLAEKGEAASEIGRVLMVYYLMILIAGPAFSKASGVLAPRRVMGFASVTAGAILLLPYAVPSTTSVLVAVAVVGIAHAAVRGPQVALAVELAESATGAVGPAATLAAMRSLERLGSLLGLLGVSVFASRLGFDAAAGGIGVVCALAGFVFWRAGTPKRARADV